MQTCPPPLLDPPPAADPVGTPTLLACDLRREPPSPLSQITSSRFDVSLSAGTATRSTRTQPPSICRVVEAYAPPPPAPRTAVPPGSVFVGMRLSLVLSHSECGLSGLFAGLRGRRCRVVGHRPGESVPMGPPRRPPGADAENVAAAEASTTARSARQSRDPKRVVRQRRDGRGPA